MCEGEEGWAMLDIPISFCIAHPSPPLGMPSNKRKTKDERSRKGRRRMRTTLPRIVVDAGTIVERCRYKCRTSAFVTSSSSFSSPCSLLILLLPYKRSYKSLAFSLTLPLIATLHSHPPPPTLDVRVNWIKYFKKFQYKFFKSRNWNTKKV